MLCEGGESERALARPLGRLTPLVRWGWRASLWGRGAAPASEEELVDVGGDDESCRKALTRPRGEAALVRPLTAWGGDAAGEPGYESDARGDDCGCWFWFWWGC